MYKDRLTHARPAYQHENEPTSEVMLSKPPPIPANQYLDINHSVANSNVTYSVNGSLHNLIEESVNTSTFKPEQHNIAFYRSYDPSVGLHTAAVLGGILVWLVLYVIYRTKIRKCVIRALKRKFGSLDDLSPQKIPGVHDSDLNSSSGATNPNATKPLINPSIVIETSPPESSPKSPSTYDQFFKPGGGNDCLSPYSLPGGAINEDGMIFQFPCVHNHHRSSYHHSDQHDSVQLQHQQHHLQLPKSELDIPNATAQWVQSMPLAARSYQDIAGLMLNMHSQGYLALHKPCSCPHVCTTPTAKLPVLDMPCAWNNSLPALSNSFSSQIFGAYEPINNHKDLKDLINAKRKLSCSLKYEQDSMNEKILQSLDSNRRSSRKGGRKLNGKIEQRQSGMKKTSKNPANLTIKIPESNKDNATLINNTAYSRSPIPIPVTPTVMIQNSTRAPNRRRGCHDSNTSISSSSSNDLLPTTAALPPPIHITIADPSLNNPYHLSAVCSDRLRSTGCPHAGCCETSYDNANASNQGRATPSNYSPYHFIASHCQCSFKHSKSDYDGLRRQNSIGEGHLSRRSNNDNFLAGNPSSFHHRRSLSDYNNRHHGHHGHLSPTFHQRSHSADISGGYGFHNNDPHSPISSPYGGNKNSPGASAPSPNLLQVPDMNNGIKERPYTLDINPSSVYSSNSSLYQSSGHGGSQFCLRHASTSDSNIAYYRGSHRPISPLVDIPPDRRHSSIVTGSAGSSPFYCSDGNSSRPRSASYFLPLQAMPLTSVCPQQPNPSPLSQSQPQPQSQQQQQPQGQTSASDECEEQAQTPRWEQQQPNVPPHPNRSNSSGAVATDTRPNQNSNGSPGVTKSVIMETKL